MIQTKIYTRILAAGASDRLLVTGNYFKILAATGAVDITGSFGKLEGLIYGQGLESTPFDFILITNVSGASNTVKIIIGDENFIDGLTGNIGISSNKVAQSSSFANVNATVTNVNASLVAANLTRQYLLIQNKDASGSIYINFGSAATVSNGVLIAPGGAFELSGVVSTQQIFAIGSIGSNANIVTVEG